MQRMVGVVVLLAGTATTTGLGMLAARFAAQEQPEGVRAIIVHGTLVSAPVLIADVEIATALHDEVERTREHEQFYPKQLLMRRPCLVMAAFKPSSPTASVPAEQLRPEQADKRWYYYPAVPDEPAVIGRAPVARAQLDALSRYGIPAEVSRNASAACAQVTIASVQGDRP